MRIGILTFHKAHNYGAVLQAFALQEYLKSEGHSVEFIDYQIDEYNKYAIYPSNFITETKISRNIKFLFIFLLSFKRRIKRHTNFKTFIQKYFTLSKSMGKKTFNVSEAQYDAILFGSDQIWNPLITKGFDPIFWGEFNTLESVKKIAYAASMDYNPEPKDFQTIKTYLKNFYKLGVRESNTLRYLKPLTNTPISKVLDPTFLVDKTVFIDLAIKPAHTKKYILIYTVLGHPKIFDFANSIAKELNCSVINITSSISTKKERQKKDTASPEEFLGYILNAECIITTSFHATVFSLLFNKSFYVINMKQTSRSASLLKDLHFEDRLIDLFVEYPNFSPCNYDNLDKILNPMVLNSKNFLNDGLEK